MAKVISGFPGVGKSTLTKNPDDLRISDSDSSRFSWANPDAPASEKVRSTEFPANYLGHIEELINAGNTDVIMVSSHAPVRAGLVANGIPFHLVYPGPDMKDEYIGRYVERGDNPGFVKLLHENYDTWIAELMAQEGCTHVVLQSGQYLADVIGQIVTE